MMTQEITKEDAPDCRDQQLDIAHLDERHFRSHFHNKTNKSIWQPKVRVARG